MKKRRKISSMREILLVLSLLTGLFTLSIFGGNYVFQNNIRNQQTNLLQGRIAFFLDHFSFEEIANVRRLNPEQSRLVNDFIRYDHERLTFFDQRGFPFFDSEGNLGDSITPPELRTVAQGAPIGYDIRASNSDPNVQILYVAKPVMDDGHLLGYVRMAESTATFSQSIETFRSYMVVVLTIVYVVLAILAIRLIHQKNKPIETILPILKKSLNDPGKRRSILSESSQMNELYDTINQLSKTMSKTYQAYVSTEEQFYQFIDHLMIGVFFINKEGIIQLANPQIMKFLHKTTLVGQDYLSAFASIPALSLLIQQAMNYREDMTEEIRLNDGSLNDFELSLRYIDDENSEIQLIGSAYDLTRIRQLERMQRDFVGNVSHELKTPVTSLIGFTETLLDGAIEDVEISRTFVEIMQKDAKRLEKLIQEILMLSRDNNPYEVEKQNLHLYAFLCDLVESYQRKIDDKHLKVEITGDKDFEFATQIEIFQPIIKNLVENAVAYTPENKEIDIHFDLEEDNLVIFVKDTGIGIDPKNKARIFERFYRVDKARTRVAGGTGLGLSIVENNVRLLGGSIHLESQVGVGSVFTVRIPLDK